jgi:hypothetical protein
LLDKETTFMFRKMSFLSLGLALCIGAACGSSTGATGTPTPGAALPSSSALASAAPAAPVAYEPCVLVTQQEATSLTGVNYGVGVDQTLNGLKVCIYGYQTTDVFEIGVAQAPDLATAQADEAQAQAQLQQAANNGLPVLQVQGVGDAAAETQGSITTSGTTFSASAIWVLKGTTYFGISDIAVNRAAPTAAAMQAQAVTVLSRL